MTWDKMRICELEIIQDYKIGNLTKLGVANSLRRAGFNMEYSIGVANGLEPSDMVMVPRVDLIQLGNQKSTDHNGDEWLTPVALWARRMIQDGTLK